MTTKEQIVIMQAYADGQPIEATPKDFANWQPVTDPVWDWNHSHYRIVSQPNFFVDDWAICKQSASTPFKITSDFLEGSLSMVLYELWEPKLNELVVVWMDGWDGHRYVMPYNEDLEYDYIAPLLYDFSIY